MSIEKTLKDMRANGDKVGAQISEHGIRFFRIALCERCNIPSEDPRSDTGCIVPDDRADLNRLSMLADSLNENLPTLDFCDALGGAIVCGYCEAAANSEAPVDSGPDSFDVPPDYAPAGWVGIGIPAVFLPRILAALDSAGERSIAAFIRAERE